MGGSPPTNTTSTVTQTNLPDWLQGPVLDVVGRAQSVANEPYKPFPFERVAGFTPAEQQVQQNVLGMQAPNQFAFGSGLAASAGQQSLNMANRFTPTQFNAQQVNAPQLDQLRMADPQNFGNEQAQQYMSPFMQNVVDIQKREAIRDAQLGQLQTNLGAARQGTYGGSRQLMAGLERERQLGMNLGDIQARGSQAAFENAQQQFERDRAAGLSTGQANLQSALQTQQLGADTGLRALLANQQAGLQAQGMGEQSRQFGAQQGLAALGQAGQFGQTLGNLGQMQFQTDLQRVQAQQQAAAQPRQLEQQRLDVMFDDFLRQRDFPLERLGFLSNVIRGLPANVNSATRTYAPPTNPLSAIAGGLGVLGANQIIR